MTVELKEGMQGTKAKRTTRVIAFPLALREQTKKDLDSAVKWESSKMYQANQTTISGWRL